METKWSRYYGDYAFTPDYDENKTVYEALKDVVTRYPERVAVEYGKRKFTYRELLAEVDKYADILASQGIRSGDKVMISCRRMPHHIISFYALNKIGASVIFVMRNARPEVFRRIGESLKAAYMIMTAEVFPRYREMLIHTPISKIILARSTDYASPTDVLNPNLWELKRHEGYDNSQDKGNPGPEIVFWSDLEEGSYPSLPVNITPDDTAVYFTSGVAAGAVNIVKLSSRALNSQAKISAFLLGKTPNRVFSFIRMDFSFGLCFALHTTLLNGHSYLINTQRDLEFSGHDVNIYKPDIIIGYPQMVTALIDNKRISTKALNRLKSICSCGNLMSGADYHRLRDFFEKRKLSPKIIRLYGITETGSVCMFIPQLEFRPAVLGIPLPGVRMKIMNPENNGEMMYGQTGVIAINTPSHMSGYVSADDDTNTVMRKLPDGSTWILSGDIGSEDEDGIFYYSGTRRRVFDRGGMHVYPQIIEDAIRTVFGVENCCAVPLERDGKTIIKVAVLPESDILFNNDKLNDLKDAIVRTCEMEMPEPMRPDDYEFMAYLPTEKYGRVDYENIINLFKEEENEQKDHEASGNAPDTLDGI